MQIRLKYNLNTIIVPTKILMYLVGSYLGLVDRLSTNSDKRILISDLVIQRN